MRGMAKILSLCLAVANTTAAYDRAIYILGTGRDSQSLNDGVVHEDAAELILQQQMISAEQATLGYAEEAVVEMLNDFGGEQERLFNDESNKDVRQKLLVVFQGMDIETMRTITNGYEDHIKIPQGSTTFLDSDFLRSLVPPKNPSFDESTRCLYGINQDLLETESAIHKAGECLAKSPVFRDIAGYFRNASPQEIPPLFMDSWIGQGSLTGVLRLQLKESPEDVTSTVNLVRSLWEVSNIGDGTIMALSPSSIQQASYKRDLRSNSDEEPLSNPSSSASSFDGSVSPDYQQQNSELSTLVPLCYGSNSSCTTTTGNCSGHGHCYLKSASKDEAATSHCYACRCTKTTVTNQDGSIRTIQWGGAACQKEDISNPFFLLAGITILVIVAVSGGIRMLFSVGEEELPSVIGAGVSSARASK